MTIQGQNKWATSGNASKEQALWHGIAAFEQLLVKGMAKKVLIAYGSRYGSTEEIAGAMAQILEKEGLETQLLNLRLRSRNNDRH